MTKSIQELLKENGCTEVGATMERFLDDADFYLSVVNEMLQDPGFAQLSQQVLSGEIQASFQTAHMLKGVIGNCGISPMYDTVCAIVEPLRAGKIDGLAVLCEQLLRQRSRFQALFASIAAS